MLLPDIVSVFIGLAFTFGSLALAVSTLTEGLSTIVSWRSRTLRKGLGELLNDPGIKGLALDILNHGAANPRGSGDGTAPTPPSYIKPTAFASAMIDTIMAGGADLKAAVGGMSDGQLKTMFQGMLARTDNDIGRFHAELAQWFDAAMDRVSGRYKRHALAVSFFFGAIITILLNIDALHVAAAVWRHSDVVSHLPPPQSGDGIDSLFQAQRSDFPFGWNMARDTALVFDWGHPGASLGALFGQGSRDLGWLASTTAALFGAPFWFDTLQRFVQIRGTGPVPPGPADPPPLAAGGAGR